MHQSAMANGQLFFHTYLGAGRPATVLDIGAQDVNGSLRQVAPPGVCYLGLDFVAGPGVDIVLDDPYRLPFEDGSADVVVSSSCFEHIELFWLMFNEILRVLKPDGLFYLNAPSNGDFHRYPVDCWRFYPDAGQALVRWAERSGFTPALLESFIAYQQNDIWSDFVAVFVRDRAQAPRHPDRIIDRLERFMNGRRHGDERILRPQAATEDRAERQRLGQRP